MCLRRGTVCKSTYGVAIDMMRLMAVGWVGIAAPSKSTSMYMQFWMFMVVSEDTMNSFVSTSRPISPCSSETHFHLRCQVTRAP